MKALILILSLCIVACGSGGGSTASANKSDPALAPTTPDPAVVPPTVIVPPVVVVTPPVAPTPTGLIMYSKTTNFITAVTGLPPYSVTGNCVVYNAQTYCWDNGYQTVTHFTAGVPETYHFDYWKEELASNAIVSCNGCQTVDTDAMTAPTLLSPNVESVITMAAVNDLLTNGTPTSVSCTLTNSNNTLDCVSFTIDLTQVAL